MSQTPANDNPRALTDDELLYRAVEQLAHIANLAKTLSEMHQFPLTEASAKTSAEALKTLHEMTRGLSILPIMSRLSVNIAAAMQSKHMLGATLAVSKATKQITMRMHYGPGQNDYCNMLLTPEVARQLSEGLAQGIDMLEPKPKIILPDHKLIQ